MFQDWSVNPGKAEKDRVKQQHSNTCRGTEILLNMEEGEILDQYTEHLEAHTICILTLVPLWVPFHVHTSIS